MKSIKQFLCLVLAAVVDSLYYATSGYMQRTGLLLCVAHSSVASHTDTIFSISAGLPATYDAAGYAATTITYTTIGKVQDFLPYGAKRPINKFIPIAGAVEYTKGAPEYGNGAMNVGDVPADAGQVIMKAANDSSAHYSMKVTYPDTETHYLDVIVAGWELSGGKEGAPMIRTATIGICKAPVVVAAS